MKCHQSFWEVKSLRQENVIKGIESIAYMVFALFATVLLPSIIFRFFYADQQLLEQPKILEYIPIAAFALGCGYFLYAMTGNFMRTRKISKLEKEMKDCDCSGCQTTDTEYQALEKMAKTTIAQAKKATPRKTKRSTKKS